MSDLNTKLTAALEDVASHGRNNARPSASFEVRRVADHRTRRRHVVVAAASALSLVTAGLVFTQDQGGRDRAGLDPAQTPAPTAPVVLRTYTEPASDEANATRQETDEWLKGLPDGSSTDIAYHIWGGSAEGAPQTTVVMGTRGVVPTGDSDFHVLASAGEGAVGAVVPDGEEREIVMPGPLALLQPDGKVRRLAPGAGLYGFALAADGRTGAVSVYGEDEQDPDQVHVVDVVMGQIKHTVTAPGKRARVVGWAGERVVWTAEKDDGVRQVWSWLPGSRPKVLATGVGSAAASGLLGVDAVDDEEQCTRLVRVDAPNVPIAPQCLAYGPHAISPDGRFFLTDHFRIVEVASGKTVSPRVPVGRDPVGQWSTFGWEKDALIVVITNDRGEERHYVGVRCVVSTGQCERLPAPHDVVKRELKAD